MYKLECYECNHIWYSNDEFDICPVCGEEYDIGVDVEEVTND